MKEKLNTLLRGCKNLKQVEKILQKNQIDYSFNDGISGREIVIEENDKKYHRVLENENGRKKYVRIITMIRESRVIDALEMYKINTIFNNLSYK